MSRNRTPDQMVEEVARLLEDGDHAPVDDRELSELVHLAQGLREVPTASPDPAFRSRLRGRLLAEAATMLPAAEAASEEPWPFLTGVRERVVRWRRSASLAVASALSATSIAGTGVAIAAQSALPGDALYGVKQGIESVRLALASGDLEQGRLHLVFARERLEEVEQGIGAMTPDQTIDTLVAADEAASVGVNELLDAYERTGDVAILRELRDFIVEHRSTLLELVDDLPVAAVPFAERSLDLLHDLEVQVSTVALFGPGSQPGGDDPDADGTEPSDASTSEPTDTTSGDGAVSDDPSADEDPDLLEDPLDTLESPLDDPLGEVLDPTLEPSLEPTISPSLPTEAVSDTIGDLLSE